LGILADFLVAGAFAMRLARSWARVVLRRGIIRPRLGDALRALAGALTGAVGRHSVGNNSRLPGSVV
jgi:hypothetical protein